MIYDWEKQRRTDTLLTEMLGKTVASIDSAYAGAAEMQFNFSDGTWVRFYHQDDCCEHVRIEEIHGDVADLCGAPLLLVEEVNSDDQGPPNDPAESYTWTFYKFATIKGSVTVRWLGESNGCYSERVDMLRSDGCWS